MLETGDAVDRYTVDRLLGEGGMADVYRVRHRTLGTPAALKVLRLSTRHVTERLVQEGQVQAGLKHPNIVEVKDVLEVAGFPALLLELVEGPSLEALLYEKRLSFEQAESVFRGILAAVEHAHGQGLIHRDLKPGNVLLAPQPDGSWMPKVADFGLARVVQDDDATMRKTRSGIAMGTPRYMSPEQIRDAKNVDQRTDIFALGAILYELVCGEAAFERGDIAAIFNATLSGSYKSPASLAPGVPERVLRAIDSSLKTNKEQRIPDCATFRAVLDGQVYAPPKASAPATEASVPRVQKTRVSADTIDVGPASGRPVHTSAPSMIGAAVVGGGVVAAVIGVVALIGLGIGIWYMRSGMPPTDVVAAVPGAASTEAPEAPSGEVAERGESTSGSTSTGAANGSATPATAGTSPSGKSTGTGSAKPAATPVEPSVPAELPSAASAASAAAPEEKPAETKPESAPKAEPAEAPRAVPKPPATKPVPVAEAVSENATVGARVSYSGDATKVWLVGSDGRRVARGVVPAGRYDIEADFGDGERTPAGELDLKVGDEVALKCSKSFRRCK